MSMSIASKLLLLVTQLLCYCHGTAQSKVQKRYRYRYRVPDLSQPNEQQLRISRKKVMVHAILERHFVPCPIGLCRN